MRGGPRVLGIVLAGGAGKRLAPLTDDRAKPAVPFGGNYRLIDFVLSNLVNAEIRQIAVLTQYKSHSLDRHITQTWRMSSCSATTSRRCRRSSGWAALVHRQRRRDLPEPEPDLRRAAGDRRRLRGRPRLPHGPGPDGRPAPADRCRRDHRGPAGAAAGGDGVRRHRRRRRGQGARIPGEAGRPAGLPDSPEESFASMGNYVFTTDALLEALRTDAEDESSVHDMGGSIMPMLADAGEAWVYDFSTNIVPGAPSATTATGATSGRSTPTSTRTWTWCRSPRSSTSTTTAGRSSRCRRSCRRPSSCWAGARRSRW